MTACFNAKTKLCFYISALWICILLVSCSREEKSTGSNIVADRSPFDVRVSDTATLQVFTTRADSVSTTRLSVYMLGMIHDNVIGISGANVFTNVSLPVNQFSFGPNFSGIDSMVLQVAFANANAYYGTLGTTQTIKLYELTENLVSSNDSAYYSNRFYKYSATELGSYQANFENIDDSVRQVINGQTIVSAPHIRIKITDQAFINRIANGEVAGIFNNNPAFRSAVKGFAIVSEGVPPMGQGAIVYLNMRNVLNSLSIYYNGNRQISFPITVDNPVQTNQYLHTFSPTIQSIIQPTFSSKHSDINYIKSMTGLKTRIMIPHLYDYIKQNKIAIANAELVVKVQPGTTLAPYTPPSQLFLLDADEKGRNAFIRDFFEGASYYGGQYDAVNGQYVFNINRHIQYLLTEYNKGNTNVNFGLNLIIPADNPVTASRVIINSQPGSIKLKLTYTVIN